MDTQRWLRAGEAFDRIFAAPKAERSVLLEQLCNDDAELKNIVASMLDAEESALEFEQAAAAIVRDSAIGSTTEANEEAPKPDRVGPWRLMRKLGDGGMGVVWLAERADGQFEQQAALKLIKRGMDSDAVLARFLRERQILARLQHPHIAHLLDGGIADDGRPYFAMEYVDGQALLQYCHDHELKLEDRIRLFLRVCAAVEFAHRHHVVHRDLKPSNVLVTAHGDVKLLDFGIAKVLVDSTPGELTLTQARRERPMSPAYAAPEQFSGGKITEATDIYALGCVLYQLLTEKYAYNFRGAAKPEEIRRIIEASDPVAPSRLRLTEPPVPPKRLRGDLDTIVLAALKHEPERRYASVAAFAADLQNYLDGKPIAARRDHLIHRSYKYLRRHRTGAGAALAVGLIGIAAVLFELRERSQISPPAPGAAMATVDFNNLSPDKTYDWLGSTLPEMLGTQLAVASPLHTLPDELVRPARADLAVPKAGGYAPQSLDILRKRLGADYVLSGSYFVSGTSDGAKIQLDLAMQDARTHAPAITVSLVGDFSDLHALTAKAGLSLREKAGFAPISANDEKQVEQALPPDTEIARRMGLARDALNKSDPARARDELVEAVTMAPGYAPAYALLAQAWRKLGYDARALAMAEQAAVHSEGLPSLQKLQIRHELAVQKREWDIAIALQRQLLTLDPGNLELHLALIDDLRSAGKLDEADSALTAAHKLPSSESDPRLELKAVNIAQARGDVAAIGKHAGLALQLAKDRDEKTVEADALYDLGIARRFDGKGEEAAALVHQAIDEYHRIGNLQYEADALAELGVIENDLGHPDQARREYMAALSIFQAIGNRSRLFHIYGNLSVMHWKLGDRDAAEAAAKHAREIADEFGNAKDQAWARVNALQMKLDESASDKVVASIVEETEFALRAEAYEQHVVALQVFSDALRLRGELDEARKACARARSESERMKDLGLMGLSDISCAWIELDAGETKAAASSFGHAVAQALQVEDVRTVAFAELGLAQVAMGREAWRDAVELLLRNEPILEKNEEVAMQGRAQAMLALCYYYLHQPAESQAASARAAESRRRLTKLLDAVPIDIALLRLRGQSGEASAAASALRTLADDAERRNWLEIALEADASAWELPAPDRNIQSELRSRIESKARQHGFGSVLARLNH